MMVVWQGLKFSVFHKVPLKDTLGYLLDKESVNLV
jgi:hypothetical protein